MHRPHCEMHPQVPALARCVGCGKYLCRDCVMEMSARAYCADCLEGQRQREANKAETPQAPAAGQPYQAEPQVGAIQPQAPPTAGVPPGPAVPPGERRPVAATVVATCAYHPGVRAVTRCGSCGALICAGCQKMLGDRRVCERCYQYSCYQAAQGPAGNKWMMRPGGEPSLAAAPWKLWPGLVFLPIPFVLSGIMTYMMRQGEEVSVGAAQLLLSLLLYSLMLGFAFIVVNRYGPTLAELGFHARNLPNSLGLGFIGGSLAYSMALAAAALSVGLLKDLEVVDKWLQGFFDVNVKSATGADLFIAGIIIVIAAPICEEIFFRGYLYPPMRNSLGIWPAIILNGFLFSAVHFSLFGLIGRTLAGALFCLLYEYNDNLWSPITAHAINNFVAFFLPLVYIATQ
jgi:CAAX protease family protein